MPDEIPSEAGMIVSVVEGEKFAVMKILATDECGVHARLYSQRFDSRPRANELGELSTAAVDSGQPFSMGHIPLSHSSFSGWQPQVVLLGTPIDDEELEGYNIWKEAEGGYF